MQLDRDFVKAWTGVASDLRFGGRMVRKMQDSEKLAVVGYSVARELHWRRLVAEMVGTLRKTRGFRVGLAALLLRPELRAWVAMLERPDDE